LGACEEEGKKQETQGGVGMATTYLHAVASLDGFIADERDDVGPLHDWYFNGDHPLAERRPRRCPRCAIPGLSGFG
jgi:hypothetical protein